MMEIREEEGERDSERRDGPGDEIGSDSVIERIRNCPMYSPTRSLTDWRADQVRSPPLDLFGFLFGYEDYLPPATTTVCNIEVSLGYDDSVSGLQFEYKYKAYCLISDCSITKCSTMTDCSQLELLIITRSKLTSFIITRSRLESLIITRSRLESLKITRSQLESLIITDHSRLESLIITHSRLESLIITHSRLESLIITDHSRLESLIITDCSRLESLKITGCSQLESLIITRSQLESLIITDSLGLKSLIITDSLGLKSLIITRSQLESLIITHSQLESLIITDCSRLESLIITDCSWLKSLKITGCSQLESLIITHSQVESLIITHSQVESLIITDSSGLESLKFTDCLQLESLIITRSRLESLIITDFSQLESLIITCSQMESLIITNFLLLESLIITDCSQLESLIITCSQMESLIITNCLLLESIIITDCSQLESLIITHSQLGSLIITRSQMGSIKITDCSPLELGFVTSEIFQIKSTSIDKPINAQALIHSACYSQPCKLNFVGAQAAGIYLTVQCFIENESNAQGFFLEGRYVEAYLRSDIKYFYQSIKKFMRWLDSSEEKMFGGLGVKYIEQKVESAEKSCITISHLKGKSTTERPKRKYRTVYLITLDDLRQHFGHKRADAAKTLGGCWIGAEMNHMVQFLKVEESNAQGYSLEGRCVKANNVMDEKLNSGVQYNQTFQRRPGVEIIQLDSSEERIFGELGAKNIGQKVESAEKSCIAISHSKKKNTIETPKRKYRTKRVITRDDLRPLFGLKRADAAKNLGVSVPTFKRYCRQNGILFWNGDGCSLVEPMLVNNSVQQNSSGSKPPEVQGEKEISALLGARQDAVTIKAKYGEGNLKFQLSSESSFAELQEAVAKRLMSKAFIVEYKDEDQEPILIACDEDWQACVKFFGNQVIRLAIKEKISNSKRKRS